MASGCIPVIQDTYAKYLYPSLEDGVNAVFFKNLEELDGKIKILFYLNEDRLTEYRENIKLYYNSYLSPQAIVNIVTNRKLDKIFIQGEWISLQQYERGKSGNKYT
ncbi:hypothetical protein [Christiangramia flava]|uniref:Uncharacterized protein n=1 Tax=Christiangramia flava JLT2011 TaxID=1229726 RepID=A0A1L7I675_9FLAO|nr:hypothetical protein [Christiangramia flava]APU69109.1 hypothetical protein GRFL_2385 [Christiangramia flava JLT2011]OSS38290.1 hypothetical protein C723_2774 [Christiangramia flava JLT2011]